MLSLRLQLGVILNTNHDEDFKPETTDFGDKRSFDFSCK